MSSSSRILVAAFIAAGLMQSSASASNEEVASFYKTRNLTIIVGFSAGNSSDAKRMVAKLTKMKKDIEQ